jgi:hypothetical protein
LPQGKAHVFVSFGTHALRTYQGTAQGFVILGRFFARRAGHVHFEEISFSCTQCSQNQGAMELMSVHAAMMLLHSTKVYRA